MLLIQLKLKSFDSYSIKQTLQFLKLVLNFLHIKNYQETALPKTIRKFTVIRSPHIDKKSREQFEIKKYKYILNFNLPSYEMVIVFLEILKNSQFFGTQVQIEIKFLEYSSVLYQL